LTSKLKNVLKMDVRVT